jgi:hypothetical protein
MAGGGNDFFLFAYWSVRECISQHRRFQIAANYSMAGAYCKKVKKRGCLLLPSLSHALRPQKDNFSAQRHISQKRSLLPSPGERAHRRTHSA